MTLYCDHAVGKKMSSTASCPCPSGGSGAQRRVSREAVLHVAEPARPPQEVQ